MRGEVFDTSETGRQWTCGVCRVLTKSPTKAPVKASTKASNTVSTTNAPTNAPTTPSSATRKLQRRIPQRILQQKHHLRPQHRVQRTQLSKLIRHRFTSRRSYSLAIRISTIIDKHGWML